MKTLIAASLLLALAHTADAAGDADISALTCVPDSTAVLNNSYTVAGTSIGFASGVTGSVTLNCPMPHQSDMATPANIEILYSDSTATAGNKVVATLYKVDKVTGVLSAVTTLDTDGSTPFCSQTLVANCTRNFIATFDPGNYYYFVRVTLTRNSTANTEAIFGIGIY